MLKKHLKHFDGEDFKAVERAALEYRKVLLEAVEQLITGVSFKGIGDFDKANYNLRRSFKDGGTYYLNIIKELIKDD